MSNFFKYITLLASPDISLVYDGLAILLWMLLVGFLVLTPLVYFFKVPGALVGSFILSSICAFVFAYAQSFGKSEIGVGLLVLNFLAFMSFYLFISYGLVNVETNILSGTFHKVGLYLWGAIVFIVPFGMFSSHYFPQAHSIINNIYMDFNINYHNSTPVFVDEVTFINSKTGKEVTLTHLVGSDKKKELIRESEFSKLTLKEKLKLERFEVSSFHERNRSYNKSKIPNGTDQYRVSWYSVIDNTYYSDIFPFPLEKLYDGVVHYYGTRRIRSPSFQIDPYGYAVFFDSGGKTLYNFNKIKTVKLTTEEEDDKRKKFLEKALFDGSVKELENEINRNNKLEVLDRLAATKEFFNWSLVINSKLDITSATVNDGQYNEYSLKLGSDARGPMPRVIYFSSTGYWHEIFLDNSNLIDIINAKIGTERDAKINLAINFTETEPLNTKVNIKVNGNEMIFSDLEVYSKRKEKK